MKNIIINTKDGPIELLDDDKKSLKEVTKDFINVMDANTLTAIHTKNTSVLIRPSSISGIIIKNVDSSVDIPVIQTADIKNENNVEELEQKVEEEKIDIITDMEPEC